MNSSRQNYQLVDIPLAIQNDDTNLLMRILSSPNTKNLWKRQAVLYAIEHNKSVILRRIISSYPEYANFGFESCLASQLTEGHYSLFTIKGNCPLLYAILRQNWDCAIEITKIIVQHKLGNSNTSLIYPASNDHALQLAVQAKQYSIIALLLKAGASVENPRFNTLEYGIKEKDEKIIVLALTYGAKYGNSHLTNPLFVSAWKHHQLNVSLTNWFWTFCCLFLNNDLDIVSLHPDLIFKIFVAPIPAEAEERINADKTISLIKNTALFFPGNQKIQNTKKFIRDYKYISITALLPFCSALNLENLVTEMQSLLKKSCNPNEKIIAIDEAIQKMLETSAKTESMDDFNWKVKVLGYEVWVGGLGVENYNLLNPDHRKYIETINNTSMKNCITANG